MRAWRWGVREILMASSSSNTAPPSPAAPPLWPPLPDTIVGVSSLHIYTTNVFPTRALRELRQRYRSVSYAGRSLCTITPNNLTYYLIMKIICYTYFLSQRSKHISMNQIRFSSTAQILFFLTGYTTIITSLFLPSESVVNLNLYKVSTTTKSEKRNSLLVYARSCKYVCTYNYAKLRCPLN